MTEEGEKISLVWKVFLGCFAIFISMGAGLCSWLVLEVHRIDVDLSNINGSRCTDRECASLLSDITRLADRVDRLPSEIPPRWLLEKVEQVENRVTILEVTCGKSQQVVR